MKKGESCSIKTTNKRPKVLVKKKSVTRKKDDERLIRDQWKGGHGLSSSLT